MGKMFSTKQIQRLQCKTGLLIQEVIILHNTCSHTARHNTTSGAISLTHPPYSLNLLAPNEFHLSGTIKKHFERKNCWCDEIKNEVHQ
jgi:hypothetical protein